MEFATCGCGIHPSGRSTGKRRYTLRAVKIGRIWVGTDTHLANRFVEKALQGQLLPTLQGYATLQRERCSCKGQRIDFLLTGAKGSCYLEIKSSAVVEDGVARFPDSVTPRGLKHLNCLAHLAKNGHRAVILFLVQEVMLGVLRSVVRAIQPMLGPSKRL